LSWSVNYDTARQFAENRGIVWQTVGKIQGIALEDIVRWRNWTHPNESHYPGVQAEWFVLNTCNAKEAPWQKTGAVHNELHAYAQQVKSNSHTIQGIYLIGSTAEHGKGNDIDLLYDFGTVNLGDHPEEALEGMVENTNIDLDTYDTFIHADGRYFHLSSGAGRMIVENTDYGMAQEDRPKIKLAGTKRYKLYHGGTSTPSDQIDPHRVPTYWTNNKAYAKDFGDDIIEAYVTFKNPLVVPAYEGGFELEEKDVRNAAWRQEQIEKGYDGLIVTDSPNTKPQINAYIPFSAGQVRLIEESVPFS